MTSNDEYVQKARRLIERDCDEAASYIGRGLRKWGRINVSQYKEKFGTVRVYCSLGYYEILHGLFYPGYAYYQFPKWLVEVDHFLSFTLRLNVPLNWVAIPYHKFLYRRYYREAVRRWPGIRRRILGSADYPELLKGVYYLDQ